MIGVQQIRGRPAVDRGGQFPAEVHRVLHARGSDPGRPSRNARARNRRAGRCFPRDSGRPDGCSARRCGATHVALARRRLDGQIDAEYSSRAVAQLVERHRLGIVRMLDRTRWFRASADRARTSAKMNPPLSSRLCPNGSGPTPGHIDDRHWRCAFRRAGSRERCGRPCLTCSRESRCLPTCERCCGHRRRRRGTSSPVCTSRPVPTRRPRRRRIASGRRSARGPSGRRHRVRVPARQAAGQAAAAPSSAHTSGCRGMPKSGTDIPLKIHWYAGFGGSSEPLNRLVEPAHVEQSNHLADHAVGLRLVAGCGQPLQHDGPDTGQREFAREHQPIRACP